MSPAGACGCGRLGTGVLTAFLMAAVAAGAAAQGAAPAPAGRGGDERHFRAGEELARTVTVATGVPISPLLGVSGLGALRWWRTPEPARALLPWYARPWFWGTGMALALLFALNTTLGALVPGLKKPMDFVEEHENKVSALVASPIVLLEVLRLLESAGAGPPARAALAFDGAPLASLAGGAGTAADLLARFGIGALALGTYFVVFLAFHAIQVMIALSPSTLLDLLLRGFRLAMLGVSAAASAVHPYVGAAYGLALLAFCLLIAGWSFRLTVFGSVFSWQVLAGRTGAADPARDRLTAFAGKGLGGPPVRSLGRVEPGADGGWTFRWRPWLVLPARRIALAAPASLAVVRGALSPRLVRTGPVREASLARFPPSFRGREEALAARLGTADVRDGRIVRGLKATWRWLKEIALGAESEADARPYPPG